MTEAATCGLYMTPTSQYEECRRQIPLLSVDVNAEITGVANRVWVTQKYRNNEETPVEAVYIFPLEEGAAISSFMITIDGRKLYGEVVERDEAFDRYDDAIADGHGAFLLDQERPNIFTASIGNLMPGQEVSIEIGYLAELVPEGDAIRLTVPTTVAPRYIPNHQQGFDGMEDGERINPQSTDRALPYAFTLAVEADLLSPIRTVESPSHRISTEINGSKVRVTLAGDEGRMDRDFVLLLAAANPERPVGRIVRDVHGDHYVVASFRPEFDHQREAVDVTFMIDCSGSMGGSSIDEARRTLRLCLRSLHEGDYFDVIRFGSTFESMFQEPMPYDNVSQKRADKAAASMSADLGGTEILDPLEFALSRAPIKGRSRRIVLLTDGQVGNDDEVIELARYHRSTTRIFSFGIGAGASDHLVRGLARASGGAAEMIAPGERIEKKVMRHVQRMALPQIRNIQVQWEGLEVKDITPAGTPSLYPGEKLTMIGRLIGGTEGTAILSAEASGRVLTIRSEIPKSSVQDDALPTLWARRRIQEIEEGGAMTGGRGSQQTERSRHRAETRQKEANAELARLGSHFGLMSRVTSYVVVDIRSESGRATETAELRRIPVALTRGWGGAGIADPAIECYGCYELCSVGLSGLDDRVLDKDEIDCPEFADSTETLEVIKKHEPLPQTEALLDDLEKLLIFNRFKQGSGAPDHIHDFKPEPEDNHTLLLNQNADGSWDLSDTVAAYTNVPINALQDAVSVCGHQDGGRILATATVLLLVRNGTITVELAWKHIIDKGQEWFDKTTQKVAPPRPHATWMGWAGAVSEV